MYRSANLIFDHTNDAVFFADAEHCLDKILTIHVKHLGYSYDEILIQRILNRQLALQLRLIIDIHGLVVPADRLLEICALPSKHIVCTDVQWITTSCFTSAMIGSTAFASVILFAQRLIVTRKLTLSNQRVHSLIGISPSGLLKSFQPAYKP